MVKVLDPDGIIIGVYETAADVPDLIPNRTHSYHYPKEECDVVEVVDPHDIKRLLPSLQRAKSE